MQKLIWTNSDGDSIDLTSGNYGITNWEGFSNTSLNIQSQQVPFRDGAVFLDALLEQRELSVTLAIQDSGNLETRYRLRRELIHALNPKLGEGYLIYKNDFIEKRIKCIAQVPLFETHNSNDSGTPKATLVWNACDPYWEDVNETTISLKKGFTTIHNSGDIPTSILIDLFTTSANNVVISNYKNSKSLKLTQKIESSIEINTAIGNKTVKGINITWNGYLKTSLYDVCFAKKLNLMVAVGNGVILTSSDGINWNEQYMNENNLPLLLQRVIYSENLGLFIVTGLQSKVLTSSDGVNWGEQYIYEGETTISSDLSAICYSEELSLFVASSFDSTNTFLYTSSDGINWVKVLTLNNENNDLSFIYYSEDLNLFVAGGDTVILTSSDGVNWNETSISYNLSDIIYVSSKNAFYASGYQGIFKSSDGVNWIKLYDFSSFLAGITYSKELDLFVVVGTAGTIFTSINGVDWIDRTLVQQENNLIHCIFNPNINSYIIVGDNGILYTSSDGENWQIQTSDITNSLTAICYSQKNKKYIMTGYFYNEYNAIYTSSNGLDWNRIVIEPHFNAICCSEKLGIIIAVGYIKIGISSDGENWNYVDFVNPGTLNGITYSEELNLFVAVGDMIITSSNGYDWNLEDFTLGNDESLLSVCYSEELNLFVAVGKQGTSNGILYTSSNGHDWNLILTTKKLNDVVYSEDLSLFIAVGDFKILTSSDGVNWNETSINTYLNGITYSKELNLFVAVGHQWIYTSSDGVNWNEIQITRYLQKVCYSNVLNQFVAIGYYGNIVTSDVQENENLISILSDDSDISFNLDIGENKILLSAEGSITGRIAYKNKYIGV